MIKSLLIIIVFAFSSIEVVPAQNPVVKVESYCTLAGKTGGKITKEEIESAKSLVYVGNDSLWKVTQFKFSVAGKDVAYKEFNGRGGSLSDEMINYLKQVPAGAKIYIEFIRVGYGDVARGVAPLSFVISE
jgi:hypothetical protein